MFSFKNSGRFISKLFVVNEAITQATFATKRKSNDSFCGKIL